MSAEDIAAIAALLQHTWSEAAQVLKTVEHEAPDGSSDWAEFHAERLGRATESEAMWRGLKDRFTAEHRTVIMRSMGFDS